ncbi:MAG TPA: hypothetical protein VGL48_03805 [Acidimicrobiales bacterium]
MSQWWMMEQLAEQHRQDLAREFRAHSRDSGPHEMEDADSHGAGRAAGRDHARPERPPVGHHLGNLLIRAGTRLGGASIRTSS